MKFELAPKLVKKLKIIAKKNPGLFKKIQKQLNLFTINPSHPSLKLHKLKGELSDYKSIYIEENMRMIFYFRQNHVVFFDIGTHDEVYRTKT